MERDGAVLVPEVPDDLEVSDFSGNPVEIIGHTTYLVALPSSDVYKQMSSLLVWRP